MEFFKIINVQTTENQLHELLSFENFNSLNESLFILDYDNNSVNIGGVWGEFTLSRDQIRGGVRFALVECPNALTWTITTGYLPAKEQIVLHLTINRMEIDQNFIDELNEFIDDWEQGLLQFFKNKPVELLKTNS
ncbi:MULTISPECIES: hypothetical protein [unclassified Flavobacterium]|jgi:hypothetical protein|uniref:hypothetical protein n=1 Tax=unclassified Flavobacterium TaxID=196869 RepID=UPI0025C474AF|nr:MULTISPECIES: hypothetical protein [unclassified Flavobacterium]